MDVQTQMKELVAKAAAARVESGMILGLGSGSTAAIVIEQLGRRWRAGDLQDIKGVPTSFQAAQLASEYGIPLITLNEIDHIDLAIDGADEVDPAKNLIKGAAHVTPARSSSTAGPSGSWSSLTLGNSAMSSDRTSPFRWKSCRGPTGR